MISSLLLYYLSWAIIPALLVSAAFFYFKVPLVGKPLAIVCIACAVWSVAYDLGYADRGKLDHSAALQAQVNGLNADLAQAKLDAENNQKVAQAAVDREKLTNQVATDLQLKVSDYEQQIKDADASESKTDVAIVHEKDGTCPQVKSGCSLSDADLAGLRAIRRAKRPAK